MYLHDARFYHHKCSLILTVHIVADKNDITSNPQLGVMIYTVIILAVLLGHVAAVNNGLARVPQLGWVVKHFLGICVDMI